MTPFIQTPRRLIDWLNRRRAGHVDSPFASGNPVVLDGLSAVAATECLISEIAGASATWPASIAARLVRLHALRPVAERSGPFEALAAPDPRAAVSAAMGAALTGLRSTAFLSGRDAISAAGAIRIASGRQVPMVLHLVARVLPEHAIGMGTGHGALHAIADTGAFVLIARSVQEATDLTLVARRVSELALVPGIVAMDLTETAIAAQDLVLPSEDLLATYLGAPHDRIDAPTDPQRILYGAVRRRVPDHVSGDQPALITPLAGPAAFGSGAAGRRPFVLEYVAELMDEAMQALTELTGRPVAPVVVHGPADAPTTFIAQGSAVETLTAFVDSAALPANVIGLTALRPWPETAIAKVLSRSRTALVIDRTDTPLAGEGPLVRQVRQSLTATAAPRIIEAIVSAGGSGLYGGDLARLLEQADDLDRSPVYLHETFLPASSPLPKHEAMLDALRRADPDLETLGVSTTEPPPDLRPADTITIALIRPSGAAGEALAGPVLRTLHETFGGHLRTRAGLAFERAGGAVTDFIHLAPSPIDDPGCDSPVDLVCAFGSPSSTAADSLRPGGRMLVETTPERPGLPEHLLRQLIATGRELWTMEAATNGSDTDDTDPSLEHRLGGVVSMVRALRHDAPLTNDELCEARDRTRDETESSEIAALAFAEGIDAPRHIDATELPDTPPARWAPIGGAPDVPDAADWDHIGAFYATDNLPHLTPSPILTAGRLGARPAGLPASGAEATVIPVLDPTVRTVSAALWTTCPDASLLPLVITARALLDRGIELTGADALRQLVAPLARRINRIWPTLDPPPATVGPLLVAAWDDLLTSRDAPDEAVEQAMRDVAERVGALPIARTREFFDEPEQEKTGSGAFFSLVTDPDACRCPELVIGAAPAGALLQVPRTAVACAAARQRVRLWHDLPDTPGAVIERARNDPSIGDLGAVMLSRSCLHALRGGSGAEPASGEKLALRHILGLTESHLQPRRVALLERVERQRTALATAIHDRLARSLPDHDLDALAAGLETLGRPEVDLASISRTVDSAIASGQVDGERLSRLVNAARDLADLAWRLESGPTGAGRARATVILSSDGPLAFAATLPGNALASPTVIDAGEGGAALALGIAEGLKRETVDVAVRLRRAVLELECPGDMEAMRALDLLSYDDLDPEERATGTALLLIGDARSLGGSSHYDVARLLDSHDHVRVLILTGAGGHVADGLGCRAGAPDPVGEPIDIALLAALGRHAYVAQTSIGAPDHFGQTVLAALATDGPALLYVLAPSPERHGFEPKYLLTRARDAVTSRAHPLFVFDPAQDGVFGRCFDLAGNPEPEAMWVVNDSDAPLTPAHWMLGEERFAPAFRLTVPSNGAPPVPIEQLLDRPSAEIVGAAATVNAPHGGRAGQHFASPQLVADTADRQRFWTMLQELSGLVTPFTERVRADASVTAAAERDQALAAMRETHAQELDALRATFEEDARTRVARGLLALAESAPRGAE